MTTTGSLTLSHSAMYFPPPPDTNTYVENIVKITYSQEQARDADVAVVFKVKCSAPTKFHVHPRIGTILIPRGSLSSFIELHVSAKEEGSGNCSTLIARSTAPSAVGGGERGGRATRDFQERFSVDAFLLLSGDDVAAAAEEAASATSQTPSSRSQRVQTQSQKLFDKASASQSASIQQVKSAAIRVFLDNVVLPGGQPSSASCVVIPPEAQVRFLPFRAPPASTRSSLTTPARQNAPGTLRLPVESPAQQQQDAASGDPIAEETRRLKEELARLQSAIVETERDKKVLERGVAGSTTMLKKYDDAINAAEQSDGAATASASLKKKRGVPFVVVIGMMFLTFAVSLYFRLNSGRGAITNPFGLSRTLQPLNDEM